MKTSPKVIRIHFKFSRSYTKGLFMSFLCTLFTVMLTAQRSYKIDDFFYRTVPPENASAQVELFDQFLEGESAKFSVGEYHTLGTLNNRVTSLIVPEGLQVSLYFDKGFRGNETTFLPGSYVSNWHSGDNWESMKVERLENLDGAYFLQSNTKPTDPGWGGKIVQGLGPGTYDYLKNEIICNDCWTHLWVIGNVQVIVYDHANFNEDGPNNLNAPFSDTSPDKTGTMYDLSEYGFSNAITSIDISLLNYGIHRVVREKIGTAEVLPDERLDIHWEECNKNEDKSTMTVSKNFTAELTKTVSTSLATGASVDFGITHTSSASFGVPGLSEASISLEVSTNIGASIEWNDTKETTTTTAIGAETQNQTILYGRAIMIDFKTTPKKQRYKETYYFRPLKPKPNSKGEYEFAVNAAKREKKVEVDVFEVTRTEATSIVNYRDCTDIELGNSDAAHADSTSGTGGSTDTTSGQGDSNTNGASTTDNDTNTVNGSNVKWVSFSKGSYEQVNANTWHEKDANGKTSFVFEETGRDEWSVYLFDQGRKTAMVLNLWNKSISYKTANQATYRKLYDITESK